MIQNIAAVATTVAALIALFAGVVAAKSLWALNRQRIRQFETTFVERYWSLMDRLSLAALRGVHQPNIADEDAKVSRLYLRLCEDQLELRRDGWISDETWEVWEPGIIAQIHRWPFSAEWEHVMLETDEFKLLRALIDPERRCDPKAVSRGWQIRRLWFGSAP